MTILVTAATALEIKAADILDEAQGTQDRIEKRITGTGMLLTAVGLMQSIYEINPDFIIQIGIAGSFTDDQAGQIYLIEEEILSDTGAFVRGEWKDIFDLGLEQLNQPPFQNGKLVNPNMRWLSSPLFKTTKAVSVNCITTDNREIEKIREKYHPGLESMEGAALHYVCGIKNIPFMQIRSVSNKVGKRDTIRENFPLCRKKLSESLQLFITLLKSKHL